MRSEFPGLLYCAGALIAVASWTLFMFSKKKHREGRTVSILRLSVIWILFLVSSALSHRIRFLKCTRDPWIRMSSISTASRSYGCCRQ